MTASILKHDPNTKIKIKQLERSSIAESSEYFMTGVVLEPVQSFVQIIKRIGVRIALQRSGGNRVRGEHSLVTNYLRMVDKKDDNQENQ